MKIMIAVSSEWLKLKRTAAFYLCFILAAFLPLILLVSTASDPAAVTNFKKGPWSYFIWQGWQGVQLIMFPLYLVLSCTLLAQIEYRNHTWKQVFTAPQPRRRIFIARFITAHILFLMFLLLHNIFVLIVALIANGIHPAFDLMNHGLPWRSLLYDNAKSYLSILGMSVPLFWIGLFAKNFIVPIGVGVGLWVSAMVLIFESQWSHVDKWPFAYPVLFFLPKFSEKVPAMMWWSVGYTILFFVLALLHFERRRIR
jgi:hypothetical protein